MERIVDSWSLNAGMLDGNQLAPAATLFDNLFLETLDKRDHVALFVLGHLERQRRAGMTLRRDQIPAGRWAYLRA